MKKQELIDKTDKAIVELVYPKYELLKAYNYYNGIRNKDEFKYLEDKYGTNTPTTLEFTPMIKKHIDALIGEYLSAPILPKVICKDEKTLTNIDRERQLLITNSIVKFLQLHLKSTLLDFKLGKEAVDPLIKKQLDDIIEDININFISEYEVAALNVLEYIMLSRETDMTLNLRDLLFDLLVTGYTFYQVTPTEEGNNVRIKVLNPLNTFIDENYDSPYVKNSYRSVVRTWMTKDLILNKYGKEMTADDIETVEEHWTSVYDTAAYYALMRRCGGNPSAKGLLAGVETVPGYPEQLGIGITQELIPVFDVEILEVDDDYVMQRYTSTRIGDLIYIIHGKDEDAVRSQSNPNYCSLSVNGVYLLNRGRKPFSLVLACAHMQDEYDLLEFYRKNLLASSGTAGDWIDYTLIPALLGVNLPERLKEWIALKKQGTAVLDTSQEGRLAGNGATLNTIFNGYDDTVKPLAIQAIQLAMDAIENTVSSITGVFRERLNGILQYDAVHNIEAGARNSFIITKQYNHQMDLVVNEMLLDCLNMAKKVFKKGLQGTLILGDKYQKIFTALPEHFTVTDHDIRITTSTDALKDLEELKAVIPEFIKAGSLPVDLTIEAITSKSIPDLKQKIKKAMDLQKKENNQLMLMSQQVKQMEDLLKKATKDLQQAQGTIEQLNKEKTKLEKEEINMKYKIEWYKANTDREYKEDMVKEAKRRTEVELAQLTDGNPYNDTIRKLGNAT